MSYCPGVVGFCTLGVGVHWHLVHLYSAMSYCPGVVGFCTLGGGDTLAFGTSAFCNVILSWCSRVLYTGGWGYIGIWYICILQCHTVLGVVGFCTLGVGVHWHLVHLHAAMPYCSGVVGVCTLGLDLEGSIGTGYVCILQYHTILV